jgi:hypothetical protein
MLPVNPLDLYDPAEFFRYLLANLEVKRRAGLIPAQSDPEEWSDDPRETMSEAAYIEERRRGNV